MAASGVHPHPLRSISAPILAAAYSPSGTLAYSCTCQRGRVFIARADASKRRPIVSPGTSADGNDVVQSLAWSPSGRQLAYTTVDGYLTLVAADGSAARTIADHVFQVAWSPTGNLLAVSGSIGGGREGIVLMNPDGSGARKLTEAAAGLSADPAWSPDGRQIVFSTTRSGHSDIWIMNADGSNQRPLLATAASRMNPIWSPDGRLVAYESGGDIWTVHADGSRRRRLTRTEINEHLLAWRAVR
jgi:TolB protein